MSGEQHDNDSQRWPDGVDTYPAGDNALAEYDDARELLVQLPTLGLVDADKHHEWMLWPAPKTIAVRFRRPV